MPFLSVINALFNAIIVFLSDNFELIIALNFSVLFIFIVLISAVKITELHYLKTLKNYLEKGLMIVFIALEVVLFLTLGGVYWKNYKVPMELYDYPGDVVSDTNWVSGKNIIYYALKGDLNTIQIDGENKKTLFSSKYLIKGFHFSPNGKKLLIETKKALYVLNLETNEQVLIDSLSDEIDSGNLKGTFSSIEWSPDSQKFCYEAARWSQVSSQDNFYVYNLNTGKKRGVRSPNRRISSVHWDKQGENLYYMQYESKNTLEYSYPYEIKVYRMNLDELEDEFVAAVPSEKSSIPFESLRFRNVEIFVDNGERSFSRVKSLRSAKSQKGKIVGIDESDHMFFVKSKWFKKRLFKIPRVLRADKDPRYQYLGGDLTVEEIAWIRGTQYIVIDDSQEGLLILDPYKRKVGYVGVSNMDFMGWFHE